MDLPFTGEYFVQGKTSKRIQEDTEARYRFAQDFVRGKNVLEIACGTGFGTDFLKKAGARSVTGGDISEEALTYARSHYAADGITFIGAHIEALTFTKQFDVIICFETIEHVPRYRDALAGLFRALRPGGVLLLTTPNRTITSPRIRSMHIPIPFSFHTQEFTPDEMRALLVQTGFSEGSLRLFGQRQQPKIPIRALRFLYKKLFDPGHRTSPKFETLRRFLHPRIFLYVAEKPRE